MVDLYSFYEDVLQAEGFYQELKRHSDVSDDLKLSKENIRENIQKVIYQAIIE